MIARIYKNSDMLSCGKYGGISLISIVSKPLAGITLCRLVNTRKARLVGNQTGFYLGRGYIGQIFSLRRTCEQKHMHRPTRFVSPDLKVTFYPVDCTVPSCCLSFKGMAEKFISLIQSLYASSRSWICASDYVAPKVSKSNAVRHGFLLSPSFLNMVFQVITDLSLSLTLWT